MRIITGDECGLLKDVSPTLGRNNNIIRNSSSKAQSSTIINLSHVNGSSSSQDIMSSMKRSQGISGLAFCCPQPNSQLAFCALRFNGMIERWEGRFTNDKGTSNQDDDDDRLSKSSNTTYVKTHSWDHILFKKNVHEEFKGHPIGLCSSQRYQNPSTANNQDCIVACCSSMGYVSIFNLSSTLNGLCTYEPFRKSSNNPPKITYTKGECLNKDIATAMAMDYDGKRLALGGGRERETILLDITTGTIIWKAKNLPPHPQTLLQQPIWTTTMTFLSPSDTTTCISDSTNLLATGTAYKQVRIYDVRQNSTIRRPVIYTPEYDSDKLNLFHHRLTSLCQLNSNSIVVGDAAGYIHTLDLRKMDSNTQGSNSSRCMAASIGRYSGPAGSVRQIVKHEELPIIACVGLDRMLRTYDTRKRKQLDCIYLRQRLTCMLICTEERSTTLSSMDNQNIEEGDAYHSHEESLSHDEEDDVRDYIFSDDQDDNSSNEDLSDEDTNEDDNDDGVHEKNDDPWTDDSSSVDEDSSDSDTIDSQEDKRGKFKSRRPVSLGTSAKRKRL